MNNLLLQKNILTGLHWEPESLSHLQPAEQASFRGMMKANRRLVYSDASGMQALGYSTKISTLYEPFALYIKELFGDGIYFFHENEETTYFLIINEGRIISGTDCFISTVLFDELMKHPVGYEHLEVTPLEESQINVVIERCVARQLKLKRRRRLIIGSIFIAGLSILVMLALVLHFFVAG
ncbi:pilus assembly protein [Enterobacter cloacae complex sp. P15RS]|uniref:pilus assembly protein n=1 Tax=Enterobacter TaxID=547 RepID=UPI001866B414|nr:MULTISPECIES: pilus assembly protein [Enterobacter]MBE3468488.1 pilus assembly protein [Enterobacter cloacae complex sp. P15RS]MDH1126963.1 pilus assembly protein [Enterobacter sp. GD03975]